MHSRRKMWYFTGPPNVRRTYWSSNTCSRQHPSPHYHDFNLPFYLYTDTLTFDLGAILVQVQDGKERIIRWASSALSQIEKNYPATKLDCIPIVWVTAKLHPYLLSNKFDLHTDHYALQWPKSMRTGSVILHLWSVALEKFSFTIHHCPGKDQGHVDGISCLPVEDSPPDGKEAALLVQTLTSEEAAQQAAQELHCATHVGGDTLWKLFRDHFSYTMGKQNCPEVARSCI